ncbi:MAG: Crp/Fnr family transcriptional regulator [Mesorhizobium sp.]
MADTILSDAGFLPFIRSISRRDNLSSREVALINALPKRIQTFLNGGEVVAEDSRPGESCMILKGFAARTHYSRDGSRQITALHAPGDFVDLHAYLLRVMDHGVVAIGRCDVAYVSYDTIRRVTEESPHLGRLFWLSTVIDAAIQRAWITCLGRRTAEQRMAHLFCELYLRLEAAGIATGNSFHLPLTQSQLADLLGLSVVHVNKRLQKLRSSRLIDWRGSVVVIRDFGDLARLAEFDPTYLSLRVEPR